MIFQKIYPFFIDFIDTNKISGINDIQWIFIKNTYFLVFFENTEYSFISMNLLKIYAYAWKITYDINDNEWIFIKNT